MQTAKLRRERVILPAIAAVAALGVGGVVWSATADADLRGGERDRVATAATTAVGGGTVTSVEAGDDRGEAYEMQVLKGSTEWDVDLDADFTVLRTTADR
jgi:hypothetical protein